MIKSDIYYWGMFVIMRAKLSINKGHRLGSAYEQELEKKIRSVTEFNSEINDLSEKLVDKYNEREKEFENKASQLIASTTKVRSQFISERKSHSERQREHEAERAKYTAEIQSLKSEIKTLKRKATLSQKASSLDKDTILSLEAKVRELERVKEDLNSKNHEIECMEKGIEATHEITSREIDALRKARLNSMEENRSLRDQISKKDNEIAVLSNPPPSSMNDSSQKLPGWISDVLRPLVYERGLEDKVMKLDKEYAKEDILEALQELLPRNEMVSRSQTDTLPNQSVHSQPAHSEKSISREGVTKQSGGAEAVPLSQKMPLAPVTVPVVTSSLMSPMVTYPILALLLIAVIWFMARKWWNSRKKSNQYSTYGNYINSDHAKRLLTRPDFYYLKS
ncbi:unnamed protein product [Rhizophagus irregularis]|nr:unnamed protein product [Rhizophagus irregularis]